MATVAIRHHLRRTGEGIQDFILNWYYACALLFSRSLEKCYGGSSGLLEKELPIPLVLQSADIFNIIYPFICENDIMNR